MINGNIQYSGVVYLNRDGITFVAYDSFYNSFVQHMVINYNNLIAPGTLNLQQSDGVIFEGDYIQLRFPTQNPNDGVLNSRTRHLHNYPELDFIYDAD